MADDTPDTPDRNEGGAPEQAAVTPRRRASTARKPSTRKPKGVVTRAEEAIGRTATAVRDAAVDAEERVVRAVKPRSTKRTTTRAAASRGRAAPAEKADTGRRGKPTKRDGAKTTARRSPAKEKSTIDKATDAVGGRWAAAAIASVAAAGATAAAMLTLRGSSRTPPKRPATATPNPGAKAHQPDGADTSRSFQAGIADENTIPDKL